jgi:hypothetical protein
MGIQAVAARSINSLEINTIVFTSALIRMVITATGGLWRRAAPASLSNIWPDVGTSLHISAVQPWLERWYRITSGR